MYCYWLWTRVFHVPSLVYINWPWWRHQMETFSALLTICAGNSPVPGEFPTQRPVTRSFDVFFDLRLNKQLSKQSRGWWFETLSCSLWRHRNGLPWADTKQEISKCTWPCLYLPTANSAPANYWQNTTGCRVQQNFLGADIIYHGHWKFSKYSTVVL